MLPIQKEREEKIKKAIKEIDEEERSIKEKIAKQIFPVQYGLENLQEKLKELKKISIGRIIKSTKNKYKSNLPKSDDPYWWKICRKEFKERWL